MINFENSDFFHDPFPHCVLNEFLNNNLYSQICHEFPDLSYFEEVKNKENDNKFKKYRFSNSKAGNNNFNKFINTTKTIKEFYYYLNSDDFLKNLNNFLVKNHVDLRINSYQRSKVKKIMEFFFLKKNKIDFEFSSIPIQNGYILPHTDGGNKLLGFVIPIIDNEDIYNFQNLGTKIFKAKTDEYKFNFYNKTVPFENVEFIRELPFKKNQMSLHVKTFNSLHGVGPINVENNSQNLYRKSISIFLLR